MAQVQGPPPPLATVETVSKEWDLINIIAPRCLTQGGKIVAGVHVAHLGSVFRWRKNQPHKPPPNTDYYTIKFVDDVRCFFLPSFIFLPARRLLVPARAGSSPWKRGGGGARAEKARGVEGHFAACYCEPPLRRGSTKKCHSRASFPTAPNTSPIHFFELSAPMRFSNTPVPTTNNRIGAESSKNAVVGEIDGSGTSIRSGKKWRLHGHAEGRGGAWVSKNG
jgi:hypothetical protein